MNGGLPKPRMELKYSASSQVLFMLGNTSFNAQSDGVILLLNTLLSH